jgi:hypothetical protein
VGFFILAFFALFVFISTILFAQIFQENALLQRYDANAAALAAFDPQHAYVAANSLQLVEKQTYFDAATEMLLGGAYTAEWLHSMLAATPAAATLTRLYFRGGVLTISATASEIETIGIHRALLADVFYSVLPGTVESLEGGGYDYEFIAGRPR